MPTSQETVKVEKLKSGEGGAHLDLFRNTLYEIDAKWKTIHSTCIKTIHSTCIKSMKDDKKCKHACQEKNVLCKNSYNALNVGIEH